ncbi:MAG: response regulator [Euryarchaeota archaeon]|nr:response regulator [Euryarchaeota archaeon]
MKKVLVVDDEADMLRLVRGILEKEFEVITASSGREALELVRENMPDVVLLDIMMPDMDGWDFLEKFQKLAGAERVPVIIFSIRSEASEVLSGLAVKGVADYITKPFDPEDLKNRVRRVAEHGR